MAKKAYSVTDGSGVGPSSGLARAAPGAAIAETITATKAATRPCTASLRQKLIYPFRQIGRWSAGRSEDDLPGGIDQDIDGRL